MIVGFTGTQKGMSEYQKMKVTTLLSNLYIEEFHHGDCVGADEEVHGIAKNLGYKIIVHPPTNSEKRAFCKADETLPEKRYLERNKDIVNASDFIIACPNTEKEVVRSGTWATIRYTRKKEKLLTIIKPK